ncbi:Hsp20/alpha crystallin family protein [Microbacterium koreense]|uniref:Hsp20/alpha crystallin family protein n=1 Tax=Microbacterium koreense TaxID=323761 RepID=A0ABW2ZMV6_9MICO
MTITPPAPPQMTPPTPTDPTNGPSAASRVIAILAIVFGGLVIVGVLTWTFVASLVSVESRTSNASVAVAGVDTLDIDLAAGSLRVEFSDVAEAELEARSARGADDWTFERVGDTLRVASPQWWGGFGWLFSGPGDAVLVLPDDLQGADAALTLSAGDLRVDGDFGTLDLDVNAGQADVRGTATDATVQVNAGGADVELRDVERGEFGVSAGDLVADLRGNSPDDLRLSVSAGTLTISIPDGEYDVSSDVSAGDFDNRIGSTPGADSTVSATVSAGSLTLRAD